MFQCHPKLDIPEEALNELWKIFKETIMKNTPTVSEQIENTKDHTEWDMTAIYTPNWACIWNKPLKINKRCRVMMKNSFIAVVAFEGESNNVDNILHRIYRLEDLKLIETLAYIQAS